MSKTVEPNSTTPLTYSKEVFDQLCLLCGMNDMTKGPGRTIQIRDEGVFTEMVSETLDWTFSCDLTEPGSPDPLTAPALPFPFTANHLAAFMLDGWGYFMQEACGDWASGPDEAMLQLIPVRGGKVKEALCGAYDAYRDAEMVVGKRDKKIEAKTQQLEVQYQEKERRASERENFRERGISEDEYRQRHTQYKASIAEPRTQMEESRRQSDRAFLTWRMAMVNQLLRSEINQAGVEADQSQEPERRLAKLRSLGGTAKSQHGEWRFTGITKLVEFEKSICNKRSDTKTVRSDLRAAAQAERDAKKAGTWDGLVK